jgi:hypothetical protein
MKILRRALPLLVAIVAAWSVATASAQSAPWRLVQGGDGVLFVMRGDIKNRIVPAAMTEADQAIPEAPAWEDGAMVVMAPPDRVAPPPQAASWREVARWQGNSDKTTEPFTIRGKSWRIHYTVRLVAGTYPQVCITVHRPSDGRRTGNGGCYQENDTMYAYDGPGTFYLDIGSGDAWTVTVEDNS